MQYSTVQYNKVQYITVQYNTLHYSTVQYTTLQYNTVQYSAVQYICQLYTLQWCYHCPSWQSAAHTPPFSPSSSLSPPPSPPSSSLSFISLLFFLCSGHYAPILIAAAEGWKESQKGKPLYISCIRHMSSHATSPQKCDGAGHSSSSSSTEQHKYYIGLLYYILV